MNTFAQWMGLACLLFALSGAASAQMGGFGGFGQAGGAMLNVGGPNVQDSSRIGIRPWAMVNANQSTNLSPQPDGSPQPKPAYGGMAAYGVSGGKSWYRTSLGVNFSGMQRPRIGNRRGFSSHVLSLGVSHLTGPRTRVTATAFGGYSNGGLGFGGGFFGSGIQTPYGMGSIMRMGAVDFGNPLDNGIVDEEVFDVGTLFTGVSAGIVHQLGQRWNVGAGGGTFMARRRYSGLTGSQGVSAYAMTSYNLSSTSSLGVQYSHMRFTHRNLFGGNRLQTVTAFYRKSLTPNVTASLSAGVFRFDSRFIGQVDVDPALQDLLGDFAIAGSYEVRRIGMQSYMGSASIARVFRRGMVAATVVRGVIPGNGVMLASRRDRFTVNATTALPAGFSLGGVASYGRLSGLQQAGLRSENYATFGSINRSLGAGFGVSFSAGYRHFEFSERHPLRSRFIGVGITWMPADAVLVF